MKQESALVQGRVRHINQQFLHSSQFLCQITMATKHNHTNRKHFSGKKCKLSGSKVRQNHSVPAVQHTHRRLCGCLRHWNLKPQFPMAAGFQLSSFLPHSFIDGEFRGCLNTDSSSHSFQYLPASCRPLSIKCLLTAHHTNQRNRSCTTDEETMPMLSNQYCKTDYGTFMLSRLEDIFVPKPSQCLVFVRLQYKQWRERPGSILSHEWCHCLSRQMGGCTTSVSNKFSLRKLLGLYCSNSHWQKVSSLFQPFFPSFCLT